MLDLANAALTITPEPVDEAAAELAELHAILDQISILEARENLIPFVQRMKPDYLADGFHLQVAGIIEKFYDDVAHGRNPRVIIVAPPQHGKSELVSRKAPAWALGKYPWMRFIATSYSSAWANSFTSDVTKTMDTPEYHEVFPQTNIQGIYAAKSEAKRQADYFNLSGQAGEYKSAGRGVGVTGRPANVIIIDDPLKDYEEAMSDTIRETCWNWYTATLYSRLQKGGGVLVMATRWHLDDLIGRLQDAEKLGKGDAWDVHEFPALSGDATGQYKGDPEQYKALSPGRYGVGDLLRIKRVQTDFTWSALYQGSPVPLTGNILPAASIRYYGAPGNTLGLPALPDLRQFDGFYQTWDGTFKDSTGADFCCGQVWGSRGAERWLLDYLLEKMAYPRFKSAIQQMSAKWPQTSYKFIEDKANGPAVIADLQGTITGMVAVDPRGGKIARAWAASSELAAGNVFFPDSSIATWVGDFVGRIAVFPANLSKPGSDDDIDAMTQLLNEVRTRMLGLAGYLKNEEQKMLTLRDGDRGAASVPTCPTEGCHTPLVTLGNVRRCNSCGFTEAAPAKPSTSAHLSRRGFTK